MTTPNASPRRAPDWTRLAVCAEVDPDLWFPEDGAVTSLTAPVRVLCRSCEVRLPCLSWALDRHEEGIWGGFTARARETLLTQHRAGRSLEDIIAEDDEKYFRHAERLADAEAVAAELRKARRQERGGRVQQQAQTAARASAEARAARARRETAEAEAAGEQRCVGPCGLVKALGEFSLRKGRRRYRVCKRCRADAELTRQRQAAGLASPDPQAREKTAA